MIILVMGPQGSGKGTQAKRLADEFKLFYLDVGSLLRKISKTDPRINEIVNKRGALVPDEEVFKIVTDYLDSEKRYDDIILDGYPRSIKQYELISDWFSRHGADIAGALFLKISDAESIRRLSARRYDPKTGKIYNLITKLPPEGVNAGSLVQREDDKPEAISERLAAYHATTEPLVNMLRESGKLTSVDGERSVEEIYKEMREKIERIASE